MKEKKSLLATPYFLKFPSLSYSKHRIFIVSLCLILNTKCKAYFRKQLQKNLVTLLELCVLVPYHYKAQTLLRALLCI